MNNKFLVLLSTLLMLSACSEKPIYSCENDVVKNTVTDLVKSQVDSYLSRPGMIEYTTNTIGGLLRMSGVNEFSFDTDFQNINYSLENIRTISQDSELGNYHCKGVVITTKGQLGQSELEIEYTAETTNNGENTYVQIQELTDENIGSLAAALLQIDPSLYQ